MQRSSNLSDRVIVIVLCGGAARHLGCAVAVHFRIIKVFGIRAPERLVRAYHSEDGFEIWEDRGPGHL